MVSRETPGRWRQPIIIYGCLSTWLGFWCTSDKKTHMSTWLEVGLTYSALRVSVKCHTLTRATVLSFRGDEMSSVLLFNHVSTPEIDESGGKL